MSHAQAQLQLGWGWEIRGSNWSGSGSFTPYSTLGGCRLGSWQALSLIPGNRTEQIQVRLGTGTSTPLLPS